MGKDNDKRWVWWRWWRWADARKRVKSSNATNIAGLTGECDTEQNAREREKEKKGAKKSKMMLKGVVWVTASSTDVDLI